MRTFLSLKLDRNTRMLGSKWNNLLYAQQFSRSHHRFHRQGFVLLLVLLTIVVLGTVTGALAWVVSSKSLSIDSRVASCQNHYAMRAAIDVLIHKLQGDDFTLRWRAKRSYGGRMTIGSRKIVYKLWDESGKYRYAREHYGALPSFLNKMGVTLRVQGNASEETKILLFEDVFNVELGKLVDFYGPSLEGKAMVDKVTLWSDGRINVNTSDDEVIRLCLKGINQPILEKLQQLRRERKIADLNELAIALGTNPRDKNILLSRLTTRTTRIAVRMVCLGPTLRSDAFMILYMGGKVPKIKLWRDLPPLGKTQNWQLSFGCSLMPKEMFQASLRDLQREGLPPLWGCDLVTCQTGAV